MSNQFNERTAFRMASAFLLLVALSLAGFLVGKNVNSDSALERDSVTTTDEPAPPAAPTTTAAPVVGFRVVGNPPSISIESSAGGMELVSAGDCFNLEEPASGLMGSATILADAKVVSCNEEHHYQMFWQGELGGEVVDFSAAPDASSALCSWQFPGFVGVTGDVTQFNIWTYSPNELNWPAGRSVGCVIALEDERSWIGSGEGSLW